MKAEREIAPREADVHARWKPERSRRREKEEEEEDGNNLQYGPHST